MRIGCGGGWRLVSREGNWFSVVQAEAPTDVVYLCGFAAPPSAHLLESLSGFISIAVSQFSFGRRAAPVIGD